ncbi:Hsp90 co-chaperone Cdc37 [Ceratocystis fimbriata CBS 114723]|uniref:Hsp90 chaperone protein kinase-targeting subunit n=1 Tax=Ceratocystis fimbriata CBS 114723 TaxID=1035309 RepID=A0A2C5WX74_9PEZI|nr:Hsp90 co-chaperone Cdc37 [Ceratocystis fimbriata CBS 114723]
MPLNYSKWDALELSDDSDVEVHPNVDKKSFIRAKQNQIHMERAQRKAQIEAYHYEKIVDTGLLSRIEALIAYLKSNSAAIASGEKNAGQVAFAAVMETAPKDKSADNPPPRPQVMQEADKKPPTYTEMLMGLLDQVNKSLEEKKVATEGRFNAIIEELGVHVAKIKQLSAENAKKCEELEKLEGKKITSESYHTGFDSSHVNKNKEPAGESSKAKEAQSQVELINPNFDMNTGREKGASPSALENDDEEIAASPLAKQFARIPPNDHAAALSFLRANPQVLSEREQDGLMVDAFDAALEGRDDLCRQNVHQALLIQYCRALGKDGVAMFFQRITTRGHQAQDVFFKDVQDTYMRIRTRAREIVRERAAKPEGVEQIQLEAVEPGTEISIEVPPKDSADPEVQASRIIFESFSEDMQKALESGSLEKVNKVLGEMKVDEAEALVGQLGDAGILGVNELIDATTEEGKQRQAQIKEEGKQAKEAREKAAAEEEATLAPEAVPDPE